MREKKDDPQNQELRVMEVCGIFVLGVDFNKCFAYWFQWST